MKYGLLLLITLQQTINGQGCSPNLLRLCYKRWNFVEKTWSVAILLDLLKTFVLVNCQRYNICSVTFVDKVRSWGSCSTTTKNPIIVKNILFGYTLI